MKRILIALAIVVVIGLAAFMLVSSSNRGKDEAAGPASSSSPSTAPQTTASAGPAASEAGKVATIEYTSSGFSPKSIAVKSGTTVTVKNTSGGALQFASDPHPQHTDNPELNVGSVPMGESKTFMVTTKGNFGVHNHLNSSQRASIAVE